MLPKEVKDHFFRDANFPVMLRITAGKFEQNEKFFREGKRRSRIFLLGDVHAAACGLQSKRLRPLRCIPEVFDSLRCPPMQMGGRLCVGARIVHAPREGPAGERARFAP